MIAPTFQIRSTQLDAWRSMNGGDASQVKSAGSVADSVVTVDGNPNTFGGSVLSVAHTSGVKALGYPGNTNWPSTGQVAVLLRVIPRFSGAPGAAHYLFGAIGQDGNLRNGIEIYINADGTLGIYITNRFSSTVYGYGSSTPLTFVSGTPTDIMFSWDGTTGANSFSTSQDGVQIDRTTPGAPMPTLDPEYVAALTLGVVPGGNLCNFDFNEVIVWDSIQPTVYPVRTGFFASTAFDGSVFTDPGIANVKANTTYTQAGVALVGTLIDVADANPGIEQSI